MLQLIAQHWYCYLAKISFPKTTPNEQIFDTTIGLLYEFVRSNDALYKKKDEISFEEELKTLLNIPPAIKCEIMEYYMIETSEDYVIFPQIDEERNKINKLQKSIRYNSMYRSFNNIPLWRQWTLCLIFRIGEVMGKAAHTTTRCIIPESRGNMIELVIDKEKKEQLWGKYYTNAPAQQRQFVRKSRIVKRA